MASHPLDLSEQKVADMINQALKQELQRVHKRLDDLEAAYKESQQKLPMHLRNAVAHPNAPLHYPPSVTGVDILPKSKGELMLLNAENLRAVSQTLGLPALPVDASEATQRQQIADFLGCAMSG